MPLPFEFDYRNPDYSKVFEHRCNVLRKIRQNPQKLPRLKAYYRDHPADFISDWGMTLEPRNAELDLPTAIPFILFDKQIEWIDFVMDCWKNKHPGLTEKSRDMGVSWLAVALSVTLCLFRDEVFIGFGSNKEENVDRSGDPKSLFYKAREFIKWLPPEFRNGWDESKHAHHMRLYFPQTRSVISAESGTNIGRGDRKTIYFLDESAHLSQPDLVEASLSATTNCRQDISTPKGRNNPFARRRFSGKIPVFTFHWRDHPTKDDAWYAKMTDELDPVVRAQEIDLDYSGSVEGVLLPSIWVQAAVDAHKKLGVNPTGTRCAGLDIADRGRDLNAFCGRYGILVEYLEEWSGKLEDIYYSVQRAFMLADLHNYSRIDYDGDGMGAGVRGDARIINNQRNATNQILFVEFRGSGGVVDPERDIQHKSGEERASGKGRTNEDFFANLKAQSWWQLRDRFRLTYRAISDKNYIYNPDDLISISSNLVDSNGVNVLNKLLTELSQPTYYLNDVGKIGVEKIPDSARSPNLADALMMAFSPVHQRRTFYA